MKHAVFFTLFFLSVGSLAAQGALDGYLKGKGNFVIAPSFSSNSADRFFGANGIEYDLKYNGNGLGLFAEYGLTDNFDLVGVASYIITATQNGLQDGGLFAKYRLGKWSQKKRGSLHAILGTGVSFPLSDYKPTANGALGTKSVAAPLRLIMQWETPLGLFVNLTGGYNWRLDEAAETDIAEVRKTRPDFETVSPPGYFTGLVKVGFPAAHYYLAGWFEWQHASGGSDFAPDLADLPQSYGVSYRQIGGTAYYSDSGKNGFYFSSGLMFGGRNVSRIFRITGGYVFKFKPKRGKKDKA